jgi:hypothetical protein
MHSTAQRPGLNQRQKVENLEAEYLGEIFSRNFFQEIFF